MKIIKMLLAVLAFGVLAASSYAQQVPQADVSLGYAYLHFNGSSEDNGFNNNGFDGSIAYNLTGVLGIVGDFGIYNGSVSGVGITTESYMGGPRFSAREHDKFVPFVQALFGGAHHSANHASTFDGLTIVPAASGFAFGFGGGTDISITKDGTIALRPQFDYIGIRNSGSTTNSERVSVSIVFNVGSK